MSFLKGFIGVRGCSGLDKPSSGVYINRMAGINTDQLEKMKDEQGSFVDLWNDIESRAIDHFIDDVLHAMHKYFRVEPIDEAVTSHIYTENLIPVASENKRKGVMIETWETPYLSLYVNTIQFYADSDVTDFKITVNDAETGLELGEIITDLNEGHNVIQVQKRYITYSKHIKVSFSWDGNVVGTRKTEIEDYSGNSDSDGFELETGQSVLESNMVKGTQTHGMSVNYTVNCDIEQLICKRISAFKTAFEFKLASEIAFERKNNRKLNEYTLFSSEKADKMHMEFEEKYKRTIEDKIKQMPIPEDGVCFICERPYTKKLRLP